MSYILDALKKSEQERKRGDVPDIKSIHSKDSPRDSVSKRSWWPLLIGISILLPVAAMVVVLLTGNDGSPDVAVATSRAAAKSEPNDRTTAADSSESKSSHLTTSQKPETTIVAGEHSNPEVSSQRYKPQPKVVFSETILDGGKTGDDVADTPSQINDVAIPVTEVPESIRRQIPSISFAGHVYSSVSNRRSVMINGKKMREGDAVTAELVLKEITPTGAEFTFQGYRFKLGALQDWSFQ